jgi:hypothetical protein
MDKRAVDPSTQPVNDVLTQDELEMVEELCEGFHEAMREVIKINNGLVALDRVPAVLLSALFTATYRAACAAVLLPDASEEMRREHSEHNRTIALNALHMMCQGIALLGTPCTTPTVGKHLMH